MPRPSCSTGTSHADKQRARVADGRDAAYNPLYARLDTSRVGIAGHSLGAGAVSYVGQIDPRVKAIVAWDNLRGPGPAPVHLPVRLLQAPRRARRQAGAGHVRRLRPDADAVHERP